LNIKRYFGTQYKTTFKMKLIKKTSDYEVWEQEFNGTTRLIYRAYINKGYIQSDSLDKLKELINNHVPINEGTFKN
jgi:N-methylhydantoinase B/oxoprolinase/acetone carboxylase alpha subunit